MRKIEKRKDGIAFTEDGETYHPLTEDTLVSMNMWGLTPGFLDALEAGFPDFLQNAVPANPMKAEYLLPIHIGQLLEKDAVAVKVLPTNDKWFGVTYKEDKDFVVESFKNLIDNGVYSTDLFEDLNK